ncbi:metalloregulator ArsR/SmtB family transcription factor [Candidatus Wolfebacteria bacterium]|nr:metalloregulator ArsR/SmtB family transcription factor [Candidatus Wolfebacteria bacterium]
MRSSNIQSNVRMERVLKALANRRRLAILKFLKDEKEAAVGEVADAIGLSLKATSKHLSLLAAVDIVEHEQRSLQVFYRLGGTLSQPARSIVSLL